MVDKSDVDLDGKQTVVIVVDECRYALMILRSVNHDCITHAHEYAFFLLVVLILRVI